MSSHIWVQVAGTDRRVPHESRAGYMDHDVKHHVRDTPFLRRRIAEGDLIVVDAPADPPPAKAETEAPADPVPAKAETEAAPAAVTAPIGGVADETVAADPASASHQGE